MSQKGVIMDTAKVQAVTGLPSLQILHDLQSSSTTSAPVQNLSGYFPREKKRKETLFQIHVLLLQLSGTLTDKTPRHFKITLQKKS